MAMVRNVVINAKSLCVDFCNFVKFRIFVNC
jgi:hypothetical protein